MPEPSVFGKKIECNGRAIGLETEDRLGLFLTVGLSQISCRAVILTQPQAIATTKPTQSIVLVLPVQLCTSPDAYLL